MRSAMRHIVKAQDLRSDSLLKAGNFHLTPQGLTHDKAYTEVYSPTTPKNIVRLAQQNRTGLLAFIPRRANDHGHHFIRVHVAFKGCLNRACVYTFNLAWKIVQIA